MISHFPALSVILPLLGAPLCSLTHSSQLARLFAVIVSFCAMLVSFYLCVTVFETGNPIYYNMGGWAMPFGINYKIDPLNAPFLLLVSFIAFLSLCYGHHTIKSEIPANKQTAFYSLFLLCVAGLMGMIATNDAFNIYVFLEISSLATYALIAMGKKRAALLASFEYLILGTIGATFILIAIGLLYMATGTLNLSDMSSRIQQLDHPSLSPLVQSALMFFIVGLALKIAMFPLHLWLTNAYTNAPSVISVFLSATATKVSVYVLIRILYELFGYQLTFLNIPLDNVLTTFAVFAIIIGSLTAIVQNDIKRLLAYSSVAQIGYIILAISLGSQLGLVAAFILILGHACAKAALFMAVGCFSQQCDNLHPTIHDIRGIAYKMPGTLCAFTLAGCNLIGIPLTLGFLSKWHLLKATLDNQYWLAFVAIIVSSLLAVMYLWRIIEMALCHKLESQTIRTKVTIPLSMQLPLWILTIVPIILGCYASFTTKYGSIMAQYVSSFI